MASDRLSTTGYRDLGQYRTDQRDPRKILQRLQPARLYVPGVSETLFVL